MKLVEVGWMLNEKEGRYGLKFLQAVYNAENFDLFENNTIKITVEFLYLKLTRSVLKFTVPIYLLTLFFFTITFFYYEFI